MHQVGNDTDRIKQYARARGLKGNILGNVDATHAEVQRGCENKK
jgi:hypothetical protein